MEFLFTLFVITVTAVCPLVIYALTSCGKDFDPLEWLYVSRTRIYLGGALILFVSLLISFVPGAKEFLPLIGFNSENPTALGLAIGGMLVASIRGNKN